MREIKFHDVTSNEWEIIQLDEQIECSSIQHILNALFRGSSWI